MECGGFAVPEDRPDFTLVSLERVLVEAEASPKKDFDASIVLMRLASTALRAVDEADVQRTENSRIVSRES